MDSLIEKTLASLRSRHIQGSFAENAEEARQKIVSLIPRNSVVAIGDSTTMRQLGLPQALKAGGTRVIDPFDRSGSPEDPKEAFEQFQALLRNALL